MSGVNLWGGDTQPIFELGDFGGSTVSGEPDSFSNDRHGFGAGYGGDQPEHRYQDDFDEYGAGQDGYQEHRCNPHSLLSGTVRVSEFRRSSARSRLLAIVRHLTPNPTFVCGGGFIPVPRILAPVALRGKSSGSIHRRLRWTMRPTLALTRLADGDVRSRLAAAGRRRRTRSRNEQPSCCSFPHLDDRHALHQAFEQFSEFQVSSVVRESL